MKIFLLACLLVVLLVAVGFLGIWILNTLFPVLAIKYGFWQVLAMTLFIMIFGSKDTVKIRR